MIKSRILGILELDEHDPEIFRSKEIEVPYFDNKKIPFLIPYADDKENLELVDTIIETFLKLSFQRRNDDSKLVKDYYDECLKYGITQKLDISKNEDVWKFASPSEIIVDSEMNKGYFINISCWCEWEEEHGLQIIINEKMELESAAGHG